MRARTLNQVIQKGLTAPKLTPLIVRAFAAAAVSVVGAALFAAWSILGGWVLLASATTCAVGGLAGSVDLFKAVPKRVWVPLVMLVCLTWLGAVAGGANTVRIGDRVYSSWSQQAHIHRDSIELRNALGVITNADLMTTFDLGRVRAELSTFEAATYELRQLATIYRDREMANVLLTEAARSVSIASDTVSQAVETHRSLALQYSVRDAQERDLLRTNAISEALRAGRLIEEAVARAGLPKGVSE